MKTQLTSLRKLVLNFATTGVEPQTSTTNPTVPEPVNWTAELPKIKEEILGQIHRLVLSKRNDRLVKRHLQQTQRECISLLNHLQEAKQQSNFPIGLYPATMVCLEEVLSYLYNTHRGYFNWETNTPTLQTVAAQNEIAKKMTLLKAGLKSKKVDGELVALICNSFTRFMALQICTYRQISYMTSLQQSLLKLCNKIQNLEFEEILLEHLFYYGYNENAFLCYFKSKIINTITQLYQVGEQYERLCKFEKCLVAQQEKPDCCFNTQRVGLKLQILAFVNAELSYYQKRQAYTVQKSNLNDTGKTSPFYRVKLSISAASLAYFTRLLIENEVIMNKPRTNLLEFMTKNFETAGIGEKQLSTQSLATKYKQVTQFTAMGIRQLLHKMIKQIEADFGKT